MKSGDILVFIAKIKDNYFLKGWFVVAEKLDYVSALKRFPFRKNVIISAKPSTHEIKWRYPKLKKIYKEKIGNNNPVFLKNLVSGNEIYYQSQDDMHEVDNWKCRRIFLCNNKHFEACIEDNSCLKNIVSLNDDKYKNYVVGDKEKWEDLDYLHITFDEIKKATNFNKHIKTPKGQHNVLRFDQHIKELFELIRTKKMSLNQQR